MIALAVLFACLLAIAGAIIYALAWNVGYDKGLANRTWRQVEGDQLGRLGIHEYRNRVYGPAGRLLE